MLGTMAHLRNNRNSVDLKYRVLCGGGAAARNEAGQVRLDHQGFYMPCCGVWDLTQKAKGGRQKGSRNGFEAGVGF